MLFFYTELPKATDHNILTGFQGSFDDLQKGFNCFERLFIWIAILFRKRFDNMGFREGHYKVPLLNLVVISSVYIHFHVKAKICQENKQVIL